MGARTLHLRPKGGGIGAYVRVDYDSASATRRLLGRGLVSTVVGFKGSEVCEKIFPSLDPCATEDRAEGYDGLVEARVQQELAKLMTVSMLTPDGVWEEVE